MLGGSVPRTYNRGSYSLVGLDGAAIMHGKRTRTSAAAQPQPTAEPPRKRSNTTGVKRQSRPTALAQLAPKAQTPRTPQPPQPKGMLQLESLR